MSEQQEHETAQDATDAPEMAEKSDTEDDEGGNDAVRAARREAANYRTKLREAEAERDQLRERVTGFQRRDAEAMAEKHRPHWMSLNSGVDLWAGGVQLQECLDENEAVSEERVAEQVERLVTERPHWQKRPIGGDVGQGPRGSVEGGSDWQRLLRGA